MLVVNRVSKQENCYRQTRRKTVYSLGVRCLGTLDCVADNSYICFLWQVSRLYKRSIFVKIVLQISLCLDSWYRGWPPQCQRLDLSPIIKVSNP